MTPNQFKFIEFALRSEVLKFGEFMLKSGRLSPYFFNAGMFRDGEAYFQLANFYSQLIYQNFKGTFDVLFGPAYKGISLATAASIGLKLNYGLNVPVSFNRKEIKDHGEGGKIIGSALTGKRVLLVDDVITAGTTLRESSELIRAEHGSLVGIAIALDRQEKGIDSDLSAVQQVKQSYQIQVSSIITLHDLIDYLKADTLPNAGDYFQKISSYRELYGVE
jgi:orotate phosphoribosyltransferase